MTQKRFNVTGIGNAIVDVIGKGTEEFLAAEGLTKGTMTLIDEARALQLHARLNDAIEQSGGSVANTMGGLASFGSAGAYIGKVRNDDLGKSFSTAIRSGGTHFQTSPAEDGAATARCLIVVTEDAQRTMATYLGACVQLGPEDVDEALIKDSSVVYLEGYLWDPPRAKEAFIKASEIAHAAGNKVSLSLSDPFCVERHRAEFMDLVSNHVDILFANEAELLSLMQCSSFEEAVANLHTHCEVAALTRSEKGAVILQNGDSWQVKAAPVERVVDTTGAGDQFAAGFLHGFTQGLPPAECGRLGALAAAEVISHYGARPHTSLKELAKQAG